MKKFSFVLLSSLLLFSTQVAWAQKELEFRNRIGLTLFKIEQNLETINGHFEPKFISGIYYERTLTRKLNWFNSFEYGENIIDDNCNSCADHMYGKGRMNELNLFGGIKYSFNWKSQSKLKFFIEIDAYYSWMRYAGNFQGGFSGSGMTFDYSYQIIGGLARIGINYYPHPRFVFTTSSSLRMGKAWQKNNWGTATYQNQSMANSPLELRIGFLF